MAAFAVVLCGTIAVHPATASPDGAASLANNGATTAEQIQQDIDDVLRRAPGARQIGPTTILVGPGLIMELPDPNAPRLPDPNALRLPCFGGNVCLYEHIGYEGKRLRAYICNQEWNLGLLPFPGGGYWNDKISSIINNQFGTGGRAQFYNYTGAQWQFVYGMPPHTRDSTLVNNGVNDIIDGMHVCGPIPSPWRPNCPGKNCPRG